MPGAADNPAITLVCFGLLGSLVVDDGLIERSYAEAIATQGVVTGTSAYARRMAQVHQARGQAAADVFESLFPDNPARAQAAHLAFERSVADAVGRTVIRPIPGAHPVLEQIAATGCRIGVLTNLPVRILSSFVDAAGWRKLVDVALSAEEVPRGFPAPDMVLSAMLRAGVGDVREVAVVHSTGAGVAGGRRSGAAIVSGVLTGPHPAARLRAAGATNILASVADLGDVLDGTAFAGEAQQAGKALQVGEPGLGKNGFAGPGPVSPSAALAFAPAGQLTSGSSARYGGEGSY